jgi:hypothetical protein
MEILEGAIKQAVPDVTERDAIVKSRVGQGRYRKELLAMWKSCAVTGLDIPELLRASHIKPWSDCNDRERVEAYNGLLLGPFLRCSIRCWLDLIRGRRQPTYLAETVINQANPTWNFCRRPNL